MNAVVSRSKEVHTILFFVCLIFCLILCLTLCLISFLFLLLYMHDYIELYFVCLLQVLVGNFKSDNGALRNTYIKRLINVMYYYYF